MRGARPTRVATGHSRITCSPTRTARTRAPSRPDGSRPWPAAAGLDVGAWETCVASGAQQAAVRAETSKAQADGVAATPTMHVNGEVVVGMRSVSQLGVLIEAAACQGRQMIMAATRGRLGGVMTALAVTGLAIASYLLAVRLLGEPPACGPVQGCETVATSKYATIGVIPVALFGVCYSIALVGACLAWWRRAERRALYVAYGLGLAGILAVAYLTYLELFVIKAVCIWCVSYGVTIIVGWGGAALAAHLTAERPAPA